MNVLNEEVDTVSTFLQGYKYCLDRLSNIIQEKKLKWMCFNCTARRVNFLSDIASTIPQILISVMIFWVKHSIGLMPLGEDGFIFELSVTWGVGGKLSVVVVVRDDSVENGCIECIHIRSAIQMNDTIRSTRIAHVQYLQWRMTNIYHTNEI